MLISFLSAQGGSYAKNRFLKNSRQHSGCNTYKVGFSLSFKGGGVSANANKTVPAASIVECCRSSSRQNFTVTAYVYCEDFKGQPFCQEWRNAKKIYSHARYCRTVPVDQVLTKIRVEQIRTNNTAKTAKYGLRKENEPARRLMY